MESLEESEVSRKAGIHRERFVMSRTDKRLINKDGGFCGCQFHQWIRRGGEGNSRVMNVRWREEAGQGEDDDEDESPGLK